MRRGKKRIVTLMLVLLCMALALVGCGGSKNGSGTTPPNTESGKEAATATPGSELKPVELTWYVPVTPQARQQEIEDAVNAIVMKKINATVHIKMTADYPNKMNTVLASGDPVDIVWTSNWSFDYMSNQQKGAFLALDDLIDKYAPDVKKSMPQFVWDATKIQGKIYALPNYQIVTNQEYFGIQKRFLDKYHFDPASIKKVEDIEPLLESIKSGEGKNVVPFTSDRRGKLINMPHSFGLEVISNNIGAIRWSEPTKIFDYYNSPEYEQYLDLIHRWYTKGYINEDAPTLKSTSDITKAGKEATWFHNVLTPGNEANVKINNGGNEVIFQPVTDIFAATGTVITTMQAISKNSKNPERAMMFLNLVNTDKELYNLLCYGIEGKDYTKNPDGTVKPNKNSGYSPNASWVFGNTFNAFLVEGQTQANMDQIKKNNEAAKPSPIMGFKFTTGPVQAEIANITSVIDQYGPGLNTGAVDPKEKLAEFRDKLDKAGIKTVIGEMQKQLDEYFKTKK